MDFEQKTFVLGVGAQKAGTSWLRNYLLERADVYFAPAEMHFFDSKYGPQNARRADRVLTKGGRLRRPANKRLQLKLNYLEHADGGASYKEFFRSRVPENIAVFGEITPSYALLGETGYRAVIDIFPNSRVFFVMRDPAERFYSQVRMNRGRRPENADAAVHADRLLRRARSDHRSSYEMTIQDLERVFPRDNILYLFYEGLFQPSAIARLCSFLGIPYAPADFDQIVNAGGPRADIPGELDNAIRTCFERTYTFCKEKFGNELPEEWRSPDKQESCVLKCVS